jgi:hypothetical protein
MNHTLLLALPLMLKNESWHSMHKVTSPDGGGKYERVYAVRPTDGPKSAIRGEDEEAVSRPKVDLEAGGIPGRDELLRRVIGGEDPLRATIRISQMSRSKDGRTT